jgi:hypothetical protein
MISKGINIQVTAPYAHAQNGKIEQYIRTIEDGIQALLADSNLPLSFWDDAALMFIYLHNRLPTSTLLEDETPYEAMNHSKPDLSHLRVWGCQCFPIIPPELCTKDGPRRFKAIFVSYEESRVGWQVHDLHREYYFSRDVIFNESIPGHLSPHHGIPIDFTSLPSPSTVSDTPAIISSPMTLVQQPHIKSTPLYHPTIANTICDRDAIINGRTQRITRENTNSLPKPKHHYNNIHTITSFISINHPTNPNLSPLSFEHTNHHDLFNFSFLSSPLPSF